MTMPGQITTADYLQWNEFKRLLGELNRDRYLKMRLLIATGTYCALRLNDILTLKWKDIMGQQKLVITENKTSNQRVIEISPALKKIIEDTFLSSDNVVLSDLVFLNRQKTGHITKQYVNKTLKEFQKKYNLNIEKFSSHTFRKTFGRRNWELNNHSEKSLRLLKELFGHYTIEDTKRYIGITKDEINSLYVNLD